MVFEIVAELGGEIEVREGGRREVPGGAVFYRLFRWGPDGGRESRRGLFPEVVGGDESDEPESAGDDPEGGHGAVTSMR